MFFSFVVLVYSQNNVSFLVLVFSLFVSHNPTSIRVRWNVSFTDADNPFTSISNNVLDFFIIMIIIIQHISGASRRLFDFIVDPLQPYRNSIYKEKVTPTNHGWLIFHKDMVGNHGRFLRLFFQKNCWLGKGMSPDWTYIHAAIKTRFSFLADERKQMKNLNLEILFEIWLSLPVVAKTRAILLRFQIFSSGRIKAFDPRQMSSLDLWHHETHVSRP